MTVLGHWRCGSTGLEWVGDISDHHGLRCCGGPHLRVPEGPEILAKDLRPGMRLECGFYPHVVAEAQIHQPGYTYPLTEGMAGFANKYGWYAVRFAGCHGWELHHPLNVMGEIDTKGESK